MLFTGYASPGNDIGEVVWSFKGISSGGNRDPRVLFAGECGEEGMTPLLSH
jgi:hypothetical protein